MRRVTAVALALIVLSTAAGRILADDDWEYRSQYEVTWKARDDIQLKIKPEIRFRDDFSDHYYTHVEAGVTWGGPGWLELSASYRHISQESKDDWKTEKRPQADATLAWKFRGVGLSDRSRIEYRIKTDQEFFRYRNRLWVKFPRVGPAGMQAFLGEEVFYDFEADELSKNRVYAGMNLRLVGGLNADAYYIMESSRKDGEWSRTNVLATALKYRF